MPPFFIDYILPLHYRIRYLTDQNGDDKEDCEHIISLCAIWHIAEVCGKYIDGRRRRNTYYQCSNTFD